MERDHLKLFQYLICPVEPPLTNLCIVDPLPLSFQFQQCEFSLKIEKPVFCKIFGLANRPGEPWKTITPNKTRLC